jgi:hypothetical protein
LNLVLKPKFKFCYCNRLSSNILAINKCNTLNFLIAANSVDNIDQPHFSWYFNTIISFSRKCKSCLHPKSFEVSLHKASVTRLGVAPFIK